LGERLASRHRLFIASCPRCCIDTRGLLPLLVKLIAEDRDGDDERADDEVENVAIHLRETFLVLPLMPDIASQAGLSSNVIDRASAASTEGIANVLTRYSADGLIAARLGIIVSGG